MATWTTSNVSGVYNIIGTADELRTGAKVRVTRRDGGFSTETVASIIRIDSADHVVASVVPRNENTNTHDNSAPAAPVPCVKVEVPPVKPAVGMCEGTLCYGVVRLISPRKDTVYVRLDSMPETFRLRAECGTLSSTPTLVACTRDEWLTLKGMHDASAESSYNGVETAVVSSRGDIVRLSLASGPIVILDMRDIAWDTDGASLLTALMDTQEGGASDIVNLTAAQMLAVYDARSEGRGEQAVRQWLTLAPVVADAVTPADIVSDAEDIGFTVPQSEPAVPFGWDSVDTSVPDDDDVPTVASAPAVELAPVIVVEPLSADEQLKADGGSLATAFALRGATIHHATDDLSRLEKARQISEKAQEDIVKTSYYIPEVTPPGSTMSVPCHANPASTFKRLGAIWIDASVYALPYKTWKRPYVQALLASMRAAGCYVDSGRVHPEELAEKREEYLGRFRLMIQRAHTSLIESIGRASDKLAALKAECSARRLQGETVSQHEERTSCAPQYNAMRAAIRSATTALQEAITVAVEFDDTENVDSLTTALRSAIEANRQTFDVLARNAGVKTTDRMWNVENVNMIPTTALERALVVTGNEIDDKTNEREMAQWCRSYRQTEPNSVYGFRALIRMELINRTK